MARTLAVYHNGIFEDNVEYALKDTPCGDVIGTSICCFPRDVANLFPNDPVLKEIKAESYAGITLWGRNEEPIGLIALIGKKPFVNQELVKNILKYVAPRAAGELERIIADEEAETDDARMRSLVAISQHEFSGVNELLDYALDEMLNLSKSKIGYIYSYSEDTELFTIYSWSKNVMDVCRIQAPQTVYQLDKTGIWGEPVRQRRPILVNDFKANHPLKRGYPEGHPELRRFMSVPVFSEGKIIAVAGVADKLADYTETDVRQLTLFVDAVWKIVDKKRAEEALLESESKYSRLIENLPDIVYIFSTQRGGIYYSQHAEDILGYPLEHLYSHPFLWNESIHTDDKIKIEQLFAESPLNSSFKIEYRIRDAQGDWHWFFDRSIRRGTEEGETLIEGLATDITERKRFEEAILLSEEKFAKSFENAPLIISISDYEDGTFFDVNRKFCELTGFSRDEAINRKAVELGLITAEDQQRIVEGMRRNGKVSSMDLKLHTKEGKTLITEYYSELVSVNNTRRLLSILFDKTEQHHLAEQLRQSQKLEAIGQLAGGVAHDFNNILQVITGYGHLLEEDGKLDDQQKREVSLILAAADRASQLTYGLLAFSRKQAIKLKHTDLSNIVQHVEKFLVRIIGEDIQLDSICHGRSLPVMADSGQIEQVLINLATNARDAMPRGGVLTIETGMQNIAETVVISNNGITPGNYAVITVSDTGTGISEENQTLIFEPFFTTKEVGKGTGLGMSIVFGIIKQHNGFIDVTSKLGEGTVFKIYLPVSVKQPETVINAEETAAQSTMGNETILVAEDDPEVRRLINAVLTKNGYAVILAKDGQEAIDNFRANKEKIELVLLDMIMPKKNGKEVYDEISIIRPGAKVLYASGYTADFIKNRGLSEEEIELIRKPVQPLELLRKVREALDLHGRT